MDKILFVTKEGGAITKWAEVDKLHFYDVYCYFQKNFKNFNKMLIYIDGEVFFADGFKWL